MNYLIQGFACSPYRGGEYAVSWGWISHLYDKIGTEDHIYVLSLTLQQDDLAKNKIDDRVSLIHVDGMEKWKFLNYNLVYQIIWQHKAYISAVSSGVKFDFVHVYSLSDFRRLGKWYKFKDAVTVFGPVGGTSLSERFARI